MESLDRFGAHIYRYEGLGTVRMRGDESNVAFDLRQLADGQLVLGWQTEGWMDLEDAEELNGTTTTRGPLTVERLSGFEWNSSDSGISDGLCYADRAFWAARSGLDPTRAASGTVAVEVVNFVLADWVFGRRRDVIELEDRDFRFALSPISEHRQVAKQLMHSSQVAVTTVCNVSRRDGMPVMLAAAGDAVEQLCPALSLATGNKITWIAAESGNARMHRSSVAKGYSGWIYGHDWTLPIVPLVEAFLANHEREYFARMIDAFIDGVSVGPALETRALAVATVLDAVTGHYARSRDRTFYVDEVTWAKLKPDLKDAIKDIADRAGISEPIASSVDSLRRRTFRRLLKELLEGHSLPTGRIADIINIRNSIVHYGTFPDDVSNHTEAYRLISWTTFVVLARLLGYLGRLPDQPSGDIYSEEA